jgi:signal transduction histidine kinase
VKTLLYLLSAVALAPLSFAVLLGGWLACGLLAVTPAAVPALVGFRWSVRRLALAEAWLARRLLGSETRVAPARPRGRGFWEAGRAVLADAAFWRQQAFLLLRMVAGSALAIGETSVLGAGGGLVALPFYYRYSHADLGFTRVESLGKALACVPVGIVVLALAVWLLRPLGGASRTLANGLLGGPARGGRSRRRLWLALHAGTYTLLNAALAAIWALATPHRSFWPEWTLISLAPALLVHAWAVLGDTRPLAVHAAVDAAAAGFFVAVWAVTGAGYPWPLWPIGSLLLLLAAHALALRLGRGRIRELERSRAGAVELQETELRRIERDLHDGAQARLVALGMTLGLAEQRLAADPDGARTLVAEARAGVGVALEELRDLARGIHPPILADRGLPDAIAALADRSPLPVEVEAELPARPTPAVETAAYFVAAESIANAAKHAEASAVRVRLERRDGLLVVEVRDDGRGGADPTGRGLRGLRQRVEALDGTLAVESPAGDGTTVRAELPCAS